MIRAFLAACFLLLMACATQDSRWSAFHSDNRNSKIPAKLNTTVSVAVAANKAIHHLKTV